MAAASDQGKGLWGLFHGKMLPLLLVVVVLAAAFLGWLYWNRFQELFSLQAELAELKKERARLQEEIDELEGIVARRNDLSYIEKLAREELGLVYPPEKTAEEE